MSFLRIVTLKRADVVVVVSPPLALGFFAWIACTLRRAPFVFHVQDLQPDAAIGLGMLKQGMMIRALYWLESMAYRKATLVSSISDGIIGAFKRKGVPEGKRLLFPNWLRVAPKDLSQYGDGPRVRSKFGIPDHALLALYSGNIGRKQNIGILVEAARLLEKESKTAREIVIVIAGDGAGRSELEAALTAQPCARVKLLPLLDDADYADMLAAAQLCLITQAAGTGQYFFPSKLLSALCARVPVIAVADADSELSNAVREGGFGEVVCADSPEALVRTLIQLANDVHLLTSWKAGTSWVDQFARERVLPRFEQRLESLRRTE
jgi:colanic acid biosynthesis glycosyl transferase WcaI